MENTVEKIVRLERNLDIMRRCAEFYDKKADALLERLEKAESILSAYDELLEKFVELNEKMRSLLLGRGDAQD